MPLTDTALRNAKPGEKPIRLFDGGGLYVDAGVFPVVAVIFLAIGGFLSDKAYRRE